MAPGPHEDGLLFNKARRLRTLWRNPDICGRDRTAVEKFGGRFLTQFAQFTSPHFLKLDAGRLPLTHPARFLVSIHEIYNNSSGANHPQKPRFTLAHSQ